MRNVKKWPHKKGSPVYTVMFAWTKRIDIQNWNSFKYYVLASSKEAQVFILVALYCEYNSLQSGSDREYDGVHRGFQSGGFYCNKTW